MPCDAGLLKRFDGPINTGLILNLKLFYRKLSCNEEDKWDL